MIIYLSKDFLYLMSANLKPQFHAALQFQAEKENEKMEE